MKLLFKKPCGVLECKVIQTTAPFDEASYRTTQSVPLFVHALFAYPFRGLLESAVIDFIVFTSSLCACVGVFIKLHISAQPGPVILIFQCYTGINGYNRDIS